MTADDERELAEWRFVFGHLGDGTPDGAGNAINARMAELEQERDDWRKVASSTRIVALRPMVTP